MTESEPPPPPAPPPPNDGFSSSFFSSLLEDEEDDRDGLIGWCQIEDPPQHINWKQRYHDLKRSLERFRIETEKLQRSLQEKVCSIILKEFYFNILLNAAMEHRIHYSSISRS